MKDMTTLTAAELREAAAAKQSEAYESFERCDTDGFLSQWASGLTAQQLLRQAYIADNGGMAEFLCLFTLTGEWVPAKSITTRYGTRWMVLDSDGNATGQFLPYLPARRRTLADKGFVEGLALWPARAVLMGNGGTGLSGAASVRVVTRKACADHVPPTEVLTTDRWAD